MSASHQSEKSARYRVGEVYIHADLIIGGPGSLNTSDYVRLSVYFQRESIDNHQKLIDSVKQNMISLVNNSQHTGKETAGRIVAEAKMLDGEQVNPASV